jgi:hypothetical protein
MAGVVFFVYERNWSAGLLWFALVPCARWALFRYFPSVSRFLGYGRLDDRLPAKVSGSRAAVTFYSFFSCPFCPIVLQRLQALQKKMEFTLETVDVTFQPQVLARKGIFSVPVVEVGTNRLTGNATTEQLAALIGLAQPAEPGKAA